MMKSVTKEKVFHVLKLVLLAVTVTLVLLSLLGTVAHASGLVDDTVNADNLYSKYPLSNYQLDFYVDNSWSFSTISLAADGDEVAIEKILNHYDAYISKASLRPFYDEHGNMYIVVDMELKGRIRAALIKAILGFEVRVK